MSIPKEILQNQLTNMLALEKHILQALERQIEDEDIKNYQQAYTLITRMRSTIREHVNHIDEHVESFGGNAPVQEAAAAAAGALAGIFDMVRSYGASKALRDNYTALSLAAVSYTMLHATAINLNAPETAKIALTHLKHITPLITEISQVIPHVVVEEMEDENVEITKVDNAGDISAEHTQKAWTAEHIYAEPV